jgi:hypothetical protein
VVTFSHAMEWWIVHLVKTVLLELYRLFWVSLGIRIQLE